MQQNNLPEEARKQPSRNKERIRFFILGFLAAAVITSAVFMSLPRLQGGLMGESPLTGPMGGSPPGDLLSVSSSMQIEPITNFQTEVLQSSDIILLLIVPEKMNVPEPDVAEMNDMAVSVSAKWEYALRQYTVGSDVQYIQALGIEASELPILAMVYDGKLLEKRPVLNVVKANTVLDWAKGLIPKPQPVFYRLFPESIAFKGAKSLYEHALGEVSLFPYSYTVEGYKRCVANSRLQASDHASLYELFDKPETNADGTFALPNYSNTLPHADMSYSIKVTGSPPKTDSSAKTVTAGGITYTQHSFAVYGGVDFYLGEIVLATALSQDDMRSSGLVPCDGARLSIKDYSALYSVLSTNYGGDGALKFGLPDLSAATPPIPGTSYYIAVQGIFPPRG